MNLNLNEWFELVSTSTSGHSLSDTCNEFKRFHLKRKRPALSYLRKLRAKYLETSFGHQASLSNHQTGDKRGDRIRLKECFSDKLSDLFFDFATTAFIHIFCTDSFASLSLAFFLLFTIISQVTKGYDTPELSDFSFTVAYSAKFPDSKKRSSWDTLSWNF